MIPYTKVTEGATAEIFDFSKTEVLKLYKSGFQHIRDTEFDIMYNLEELDINTPKIYEKFDIDERVGYTMQKIEGSTLKEKLEKGEISAEKAIENLCVLQRQLSSIDTINRTMNTLFTPIKQTIKERITNSSQFSTEQIRQLLLLIEPEREEVLCHNDIHFNNIISTNSKEYLIDWNGAGYNEFTMEVAKICIVLQYASLEIVFGKKMYQKRDEIASLYENYAVETFNIDTIRLSQCKIVRAAEIASILSNIPNIENHPYKQFRDDVKQYTLSSVILNS